MEATIGRTRLLYYFNMVAGMTAALLLNVNWWVVLIVFILMNWCGVTMTYHRYWSHKTFEFKSKWVLYLFNLFAHLSCSGSAIGWANIHRQHHRHSDEEKDPHQAERGFWRIMLMDYQMEEGGRYVVDLIRQKYLLLMHRYYFLIIAGYGASLWLWDMHLVFEALIIPAAITMFAEHLTNYVNHRAENDYQPVNVWWMNFLSGGDGWHKNHHDNPRSYTTQEKWYEFDPTGQIIRLCRSS